MTTPKRAVKKPAKRVDNTPEPAPLPQPEPTPQPQADKPNWLKRLLYAAVVGYVIWSLTRHKAVPQPAPEPTPVAGLVSEIASLFPPDQNETASLYAAYCAAQADKALHDKQPVMGEVCEAARDALGLPHNAALAAIFEREMAQFEGLKLPWEEDQVAAYVEKQREFSAACLAASVD